MTQRFFIEQSSLNEKETQLDLFFILQIIYIAIMLCC